MSQRSGIRNLFFKMTGIILQVILAQQSRYEKIIIKLKNPTLRQHGLIIYVCILFRTNIPELAIGKDRSTPPTSRRINNNMFSCKSKTMSDKQGSAPKTPTDNQYGENYVSLEANLTTTHT